MKHAIISVVAVGVLLLCGTPSAVLKAQSVTPKDYKSAVALYQHGLYEEAKISLDNLTMDSPDMYAEGYSLLCSLKLQSPGYDKEFESYIDKYPYCVLVPKIRYAYAQNLFDAAQYEKAAYQFSTVNAAKLGRRQSAEYYFKYAYSEFECGRHEQARRLMEKVDGMNSSDYSAPARYALGYIAYEDKEFNEAIRWFEKSSKDERFKGMSEYYIVDCKFMLKDYEYVSQNGPACIENVPEECQPHLARIISESMLVLGDTDGAKKYFSVSREPETRSDFFFAGSLMYAARDWKAAVENYTKMEDRSDSLGQIANYNLGYSYIMTRNKVAAMRAFKDASAVTFDKSITEDALFNYAKLAFDLNNDASGFGTYMQKYSSKANNDRIYSYIAVAALRNRDYAAAVEAFDKIDDLDEDMRGNYMKTNYLRASQLIADGAYKGAIPCLKAAAYYSSKNSGFWQLSRFWLAESYFRSGDYSAAKTTFRELYNQSALDGRPESTLIPFSLGYCFFKEGDYEQAIKWFDEYIASGAKAYRKGAYLRKADCYFMGRLYKTAIPVYEKVTEEYKNVNDIYSYYQTGLCYGLTGNDAKKITALLPVKQASPDSRFYSEAMYELGRAYVATKKTADAQKCFQTLLDNAKDSTYMAMSLIELGMLSRNAKKYDEALGYYKRVVEQMPVSEQTDNALAAIESIYQSKADPQSYLAYLESIGRSSLKTDAEKELMIFNAAEQIYLSEDYEKALASLEGYMKNYPSGRMMDKAWFYKADCCRNLGRKEEACDAFRNVIGYGPGSYYELSLTGFADLAYGLQRYEEAYLAYVKLLSDAQFDENRWAADKGKMWAAYKGRMFDRAIEAAAVVKSDPRADEDLARTADWITAKSLLATSRRDEALDILVTLAVKPRTAEGAEAVFLMIQDAFDRGDFEKAEDLVYSFAESGSSQQYWIAKSFLVLGDSFVERGDIEQARATFESVLEGYTPQGADDDILESAASRIERLNQMN